jgi:tRNA-2-methylthio-N6-dimethylallyladenosine synthase
MSRSPGTTPPNPRGSARYHIETWGCQMNVHDSEKLAGLLESEGYGRAEGIHDADVVLLNTCSVREKASEKFFSELGRLKPWKRGRPDAVLGVCGCVGQEQGAALLERAPHVDFVLGPRAAPGSLAGLLRRLLAGDASARHTVDIEYRDDSIRFPFDRILRQGEGSGKAYVTVVEGCNHRCSFCIVPTTRGRETCRDLDDVLAEVRSLAARGVLEVEFLGQTVNAYRDGAGRTLADLLPRAAAVNGIRRIRFTTSHPAQMTDGLVDAMSAARPKLCPYLHLPFQSGSSAVLRAMKRGYDREGYLERIGRIRARIPEMTFGTDVIVGFPGEGEDEFLETLALVETVGFETVYSFTYSPRPGTAALALGDPVPKAVKLERLARLQAMQKRIQETRNAAWIGRVVEVLVEGPSARDRSAWSGRTPESRVVNFSGAAAPGRMAAVEVTRASAYAFYGRAVASA